MPENDRHLRRRRTIALRAGAVAPALGAILIAVWYLARETDLPEGVSRKEYASAERQYRKIYGSKAGRIDVLSLAGELAVGEGRLESAAACFHAIPSENPRYGPSARLQEGQVLLRLNRVDDAERAFRGFLALAARNRSIAAEHVISARKWLGYILSVELRLEDRKLLLADVHADGQADVFDSKQYYFPTLLLWHSSTGRRRLTELLAEDPANRHLRIAEGRYLTSEGRLDEAHELLETLRLERADDLSCAAALLECLFENDGWTRLAEIVGSLPQFTEGEPWLLTRMRGEFALHERRWADAAQHFENVLGVDPADPACHMGLAKAYAEQRRPEAAEQIRRQSAVLAQIRVNLVNVNEDDYAAAFDIAEKCKMAGLQAAAETFRQHALRIERAKEGTGGS